MEPIIFNEAEHIYKFYGSSSFKKKMLYIKLEFISISHIVNRVYIRENPMN